MQRARLPPETVDQIIDVSDPACLKTFALVSRTWLPRSRFHFFKHPKPRSCNFSAFMNLARAPSCSFLPHVRAITLSGSGWNSLSATLEELTVFPSLDTLQLFKITLDGEPTFPSFHQFKILRLSQVTFESFVHLTNVVSAFKSIKQLYIDDAGWLQEADSKRVRTTVPPGLQVVELGTVFKAPTVEWLTARPHADPSQVHTVILQVSRLTELRPATQYLHSVESSLEHLELVVGLWVGERLAKILDLSRTTTLKSLHLHLWRMSTDWILSLLSRIRSPHFTDLIFTLWGDPTVIRQGDPLSFDAALSAKTVLPTLRLVHVRFRRPQVNRKTALQILTRLFPTCDRREMVVLDPKE